MGLQGRFYPHFSRKRSSRTGSMIEASVARLASACLASRDAPNFLAEMTSSSRTGVQPLSTAGLINGLDIQPSFCSAQHARPGGEILPLPMSRERKNLHDGTAGTAPMCSSLWPLLCREVRPSTSDDSCQRTPKPSTIRQFSRHRIEEGDNALRVHCWSDGLGSLGLPWCHYH